MPRADFVSIFSDLQVKEHMWGKKYLGHNVHHGHHFVLVLVIELIPRVRSVIYTWNVIEMFNKQQYINNSLTAILKQAGFPETAML